MHGGGRILVTVLILALFAPPADASAWQVCGNSGTYTAGSAYQANLNRMADTLPANTSSSPILFATGAVGAGANPNQTVYALALCRGDLDASFACLVCVNAGFRDGQVLCDSDMDVTMFYDACHVRYSNRNFQASTNNSQQHAFFSSSPSLASSVAARFQTLVTKLLNATADYAVANSTRKFATGEMEVDRDYFGGQFDKISSLAQCTPDLTSVQCRACLAAAMSEMPRLVFPSNPRGARVVGERCGLRFDVFPFYDGKPMVRLQVGGPGVNVDDMESFESIFISLSTLQSATSNFDEKNKLGEGGFGAVYKGALPNGQEVAVKKLCQISKQGAGQMKNELALIAKLQHKNLVRLVGVCLEGGEHLLVYEYMPNRSLDTILFDPENGKQLDWGARCRILNGIARGLQYLHEHSQLKIVHRDLKASNILLDADMKPKISDFGLAKIFTDDETRNVTSRAIGTLGYMSPEYAMRGHYSTKLDVFSFGVLVLEMVTGRRNNFAVNSERFQDLFCLVWKHWVEGTIAEIADPSLGRHYPRGEVLKCINIGLLCVSSRNPLTGHPCRRSSSCSAATPSL